MEYKTEGFGDDHNSFRDCKISWFERKRISRVEVNRPKKDYFGALKGIGRFTEDDELKGQLENCLINQCT